MTAEAPGTDSPEQWLAEDERPLLVVDDLGGEASPGDPAELLAAAFEAVENSGDGEGDFHGGSGDLDFADAGIFAVNNDANQQVLTLEEAQAKIAPEALQALADRFMGSLTQVRRRDTRDRLF